MNKESRETVSPPEETEEQCNCEKFNIEPMLSRHSAFNYRLHPDRVKPNQRSQLNLLTIHRLFVQIDRQYSKRIVVSLFVEKRKKRKKSIHGGEKLVDRSISIRRV